MALFVQVKCLIKCLCRAVRKKKMKTGASSSLDIPSPWSGRFWGRTQCSTDASGKFICGTADCGSGQVACKAGAIPPASLIELTLAPDGEQDFCDVSLVDGFNVPLELAPQGGSGGCSTTSCPANANCVCPAELAVKGSDQMAVTQKCLFGFQPAGLLLHRHIWEP